MATTTIRVFTTMSNTTNALTTQSLIPYWSLPGRVLLSMSMILIMALAIFGNALVILVIARNHGMQTRTNFFLMNLAVADFLCGCIDMPFSLITVIRGEWIFNNNVCQMNSFATPFFFVASIHTLMYIAVFKFLSIHNPFKFAMSRRQILMMITAAWMWAAIIGTLSVVGLSTAEFEPYTTQCGPNYHGDAKSYAYFGLLLITCYVIPLCVIAFCYGGMFREIRSHGRRLRHTSIVDREKIYAQQRGILVTLLVVVIAFLVTWTPWAVYSLYAILSTDHATHWVNPITFWLGYANSACNPIIYALRSQTFRDGYKQLVAKQGPADAGYQVASRSSGGTHIWRNTTRTDSSFLRRTSTKEKSQFAYSLPTRRRLSSAGSLPDGFVTGHESEHIPLRTLNGNSHQTDDFIGPKVEPFHHAAHDRSQGSVRGERRESKRTRRRETGQGQRRNLSPSAVIEKQAEATGEIEVNRRRSKRHGKTNQASSSLKPKPSVREFRGLTPDLKQWLVSRELGRETENPDVIEVFTDAAVMKKLIFQPSSVMQSCLGSNIVKEYSRSVCSLCSNPECDTKDGSSQHRKSFGHVKKQQCKQTPSRKVEVSKPVFCRYPSIDELDESRPKRHRSPSMITKHRNPFIRAEKWFHRHKLVIKSDLDEQDLEQGQPLNRSSSNFDHVLPGMFRSSSAPCL